MEIHRGIYLSQPTHHIVESDGVVAVCVRGYGWIPFLFAYESDLILADVTGAVFPVLDLPAVFFQIVGEPAEEHSHQLGVVERAELHVILGNVEQLEVLTPDGDDGPVKLTSDVTLMIRC